MVSATRKKTKQGKKEKSLIKQTLCPISYRFSNRALLQTLVQFNAIHKPWVFLTPTARLPTGWHTVH